MTIGLDTIRSGTGIDDDQASTGSMVFVSGQPNVGRKQSDKHRDNHSDIEIQ